MKNFTEARLKEASEAVGVLITEVDKLGYEPDMSSMLTMRLEALTEFTIAQAAASKHYGGPPTDEQMRDAIEALAMEFETIFTEKLRDAMEGVAQEARKAVLQISPQQGLIVP